MSLCTAARQRGQNAARGLMRSLYVQVIIKKAKATAVRAGTGLAVAPATQGTRTRVHFDSAVDMTRSLLGLFFFFSFAPVVVVRDTAGIKIGHPRARGARRGTERNGTERTFGSPGPVESSR